MTFNDIFQSSFLESVSEFSLLDTAIGLTSALIMGLFIFVIYQKTLTGVMYSTGFALTLVGLSLGFVNLISRLPGVENATLVSYNGEYLS